MIDDTNNIREDPYKGGYTDKGLSETKSEEGDVHYMILKATPKELMIMTNYWKYLSCQRQDYK